MANDDSSEETRDPDTELGGRRADEPGSDSFAEPAMKPAAEEAGGRHYAAAYAQLRSIASALMTRERAGHTLQPTALVHEAYFKLVGSGEAAARDRVHFLAIASRAMRQVLVDHARSRGAAKRAGVRATVRLDSDLPSEPHREAEILDLDRALTRLGGLSERAARVVELRVFGGLTHEEIAEVLRVSVRTVAGDWQVARHWLRRELLGESS